MTGAIRRLFYRPHIKRLHDDLAAARDRYDRARQRGDTRGQREAEKALRRARTELMKAGA